MVTCLEHSAMLRSRRRRMCRLTECYPYGGNLRIHGYAIICAVPIPVVSVWGCDSLRTAPRGVLNYWRKSDG